MKTDHNILQISLIVISTLVSIMLIFNLYPPKEQNLFMILGLMCLGFLYIGSKIDELKTKK